MKKRNRKLIPLEDRFWTKVDKNGPVIRLELGQCWVWTAATIGRRVCNYGVIQLPRRAGTALAHRVGYKLQLGSIPDGSEVLHHCDNALCVRGSHLYLGSQSDNMRDAFMRGKKDIGSKQRNKTHCASGHPYNDENTYFKQSANRGKGSRQCRACRRQRRHKKKFMCLERNKDGSPKHPLYLKG